MFLQNFVKISCAAALQLSHRRHETSTPLEPRLEAALGVSLGTVWGALADAVDDATLERGLRVVMRARVARERRGILASVVVYV